MQDKIRETPALKKKVLNIFIHYIKHYIYIIIFAHYVYEYADMHERKTCTIQGRDFRTILTYGTYCILLLNILMLIIVFWRDAFQRFQFFTVHILNLIWFAVLMFLCVYSIIQRPVECISTSMMQKFYFVFSIKMEIETFIIIFLPYAFTIKQFNLATNLIFPYLFLTTSDMLGEGTAVSQCGKNSRHIAIGISLIHVILSVISALISSLVHIQAIKKTVKKALYFYYTLCLIVLCLALVFILLTTSPELYPVNFTCAQIWIILKSYMLINPLSFLGMMFLFFAIAKKIKLVDQQQNQMLDNEKNQYDQSGYKYSLQGSRMHSRNQSNELTKDYRVFRDQDLKNIRSDYRTNQQQQYGMGTSSFTRDQGGLYYSQKYNIK